MRDEAQAQEFYDELDEYLEANGITHFSAREVCRLDRKVWADGKRASMEPAPRGLWPHIVPTLKALEKLRADLGAPIYVTSGYRPRLYNKLVGGSGNSLHVAFNAIDFRTRSGHSSLALARRLHASNASDELGIGWYFQQDFVHVDTRGFLGRQAPARWPQEPRWWE